MQVEHGLWGHTEVAIKRMLDQSLSPQQTGV